MLIAADDMGEMPEPVAADGATFAAAADGTTAAVDGPADNFAVPGRCQSGRQPTAPRPLDNFAAPARPFNATLAALPVTVFERMSRLAAECDSLNLGQGFPDRELEGPASLKAEVARALAEESCQYPPSRGVEPLLRAVAAHSVRHAGVPVEWRSEALATVGATEALASAFLGLLNPGDEAIILEPAYDSYVPMIRLAGATPVAVRLAPPAWALDAAALRAAFSPRTKLLVLNSPHNPTGKCFTSPELEMIASLLLEFDAYAVCDEVYEHLVFPGAATHASLRALPGMAARCVRVGSAGKTFAFTDLKVGWATGPPAMIATVAKAHAFLTFTVNSALQRAVALGLERERSFYGGLGAVMADKRARLAPRLEALGFAVLPAQATYFLAADFAPLLPLLADSGAAAPDDVAVCERLTREARVTLLPLSAFYVDAGAAGVPRTLVRVVTCKTDVRLDEACARLEAFFGELRRRAA